MKLIANRILGILLILTLITNKSNAQSLTSKDLDSLVLKTMKTFEVPGIALAVIKDNKIIKLQSYGLRSIENNKPVDLQTAFAIASNSKAFTAFALGMLVDEKKIQWDSKVTDIIPEFKLHDPFITRDFTIRDLLTHRSGLGLGAGDLMFFPDSANFTKEEVIHNLRFLKPVSSFRTKFDYDNLLYIVAGEVLARVSGMSWEDFIEKKIMAKLEMKNSAASLPRMKNKSNTIDAHLVYNNKLQTTPRFLSPATNPAGGINSSIEDMSKWATMLLNRGKYGKNLEHKLISDSSLREMMTIQTIIKGGTPYNTHFLGYGLGFFLSDQNGKLVAEHTGGLAGMVTQMTLIPELNLGIIVLTNQQVGAAFTAITNQIKDDYFGIKDRNWLSILEKNHKAAQNQGDEITKEVWKVVESNKTMPNLKPFVGTYWDNWFGDISISEKNDHLFFESKRSPMLKGKMHFYKGNTFVVAWNDRTMNADAFANFILDEEGNPESIKMRAFSPLTDFSFDFHDLDLKRVIPQNQEN